MNDLSSLPFLARDQPASGYHNASLCRKLMLDVQQALAYHLQPNRRHDELLMSALYRPSQVKKTT